MDDGINSIQKEFYIKQVDKYTKQLESINRWTTLSIFVTALGSMYFFARYSDALSEHFVLEVNSHIEIVMASAGFINVIGLIYHIAKKTGIEIRIEEIEEYFEYNGLTLEDEVSKGRSK